MDVIISSKNVEVSQRLRTRIERKIDKLGRYFNPSTEVQVRLKGEGGDRRIAEITIPFEGAAMRAEETTDDLYQSVDQALIKIEKQIHRHRTKLGKRLREDAFSPELPEYFEEAPAEEETEHVITRVKRYTLKPMSVNDAIDQMQMLHHDFFVFVNSDTHATCVVYQRHDGGYALLEPEA